MIVLGMAGKERTGKAEKGLESSGTARQARTDKAP